MTKRLEGQEWEAVLSAFALGNPVLVVGPGCHRVGYDDPDSPAWAKVHDRVNALYAALGHEGMRGAEGPAQVVGRRRDERQRRYLEAYWVSKLSDPQKAFRYQLSALPGDAEERAVGAISGGPVLPAHHMRLLLEVFGALWHASSCLGAVVAAGTSPVIDWGLVAHRVDDDAEADDADTQRDDEGEAHRAAGEHLYEAASLARGIATLVHEGPVLRAGMPAYDEVVRRLGFCRELRWSESTSMRTLKINDVAGMLESLHKTCFEGSTGLSGALVEWLGDLFWHLLSADVGVPPSEAQTAFYVNLDAQAEVSEHGFSRPRPGDYRTTGGAGDLDVARRALTSDVNSLVAAYAETDWDRPWGRLSLTLAASLLAQWQGRPTTALSPAPHYPIALCTDYDAMLEHALFSLIEPDEMFHVIVPVWMGRASGTSLEWLFGTTQKQHPTDPPKLARRARWRWLPSIPEPAAEVVKGPIVVKLSGSPLHQIAHKSGAMNYIEGRVEDLELEMPHAFYDKAEVWPATIFSEHDALQAAMSFWDLPRHSDRKHVPLDVVEILFSSPGLSWNGRSWLFFGNRFADWLPRLRVFLGAIEKPEKEGEDGRVAPCRDKMAFDRAFDWPERALLNALEVTQYQTDLVDFDGYQRRTPAAGAHTDTALEFLQRVGALMPDRKEH